MKLKYKTGVYKFLPSYPTKEDILYELGKIPVEKRIRSSYMKRFKDGTYANAKFSMGILESDGKILVKDDKITILSNGQ